MAVGAVRLTASLTSISLMLWVKALVAGEPALSFAVTVSVRVWVALAALKSLLLW